MKQFGFTKTEFDDVIKIDLFSASDKRGDFLKIYSQKEFAENNVSFTPVEEALIKSNKGVLRGLHFQRTVPQDKLISCVYGDIWFAVLDVEPGSETFGKWTSCELKAGSGLYIPGKYAIGSQAIEDSLFHISYATPFIAEYSSGIKWNDTDLGIDWPDASGVIIADKDAALQSFIEYTNKIAGEIENE